MQKRVKRNQKTQVRKRRIPEKERTNPEKEDESGTNDEQDEETASKDSEENESVPQHENDLDAERMKKKACKPPSEYQKGLKLFEKCYIEMALSIKQAMLRPKEVDWFIEHPQFQHFFHLKNPKQKWMGLWIIVVRLACAAKKYELWFIVNGVPIRYSLRELGHIHRLYCHDYLVNHESLGGTPS